MRRWLNIGIPIAIGIACFVSVTRNGFDPEHPTFWYCLLMVMVVASLVSIIRRGLDRSIPMSKSNRLIRVIGGSIWALLILGGMAAQVWKALR
jgi:hypothetical protein